MNSRRLPGAYEFAGRKVTVIGLGLFSGGVETIRYLVRCGADVTVTDLKDEKTLGASLQQIADLPVRIVLGRHEKDDFTKADTIVVSPAVPDSSEYLKLAKEAGVALTTEMNIFFEHCPARILGVTGSNGKTTTAHLAFEMLRRSPTKALLGGNVGRSLINLLDGIEPGGAVVLELSSFQLERLRWAGKSPHLALITNLTPNHLDRHGTMQAYRLAKQAILDYQGAGDYAVLNLDDPEFEHWEACAKGEVLYYSATRHSPSGARLRGDILELVYRGIPMPICRRDEVRLPGLFNISNALAAACAAFCFGAKPEHMAQALRTFAGIEHRLEFVLEHEGVRYYNDSIATNPESTIAALSAFGPPIILIAGGYDKQLPFDALGPVIAQRVADLVLVGNTAEKIQRAVAAAGGGPSLHRCTTFENAVKTAISLASAPGVVLLSPACASYDMFDNFQQRGDLFKEIVRDHAGAASIPASGKSADLRETLDALAAQFSGVEYIEKDPLGEVLKFAEPGDREVAAFIAAGFAFGNIGSILKHLRRVFAKTGPRIAEFVRGHAFRADGSPFDGLKYRWITPEATSALFHVLGEMLRTSGSIESFFSHAEGPEMRERLLSFCERAVSLKPAGISGTGLRGLKYFFSVSGAGGAAKRLNLFLRWVVRKDAPDLGLWSCIAPSELVIPLDVHVARAALDLGLASRRTRDWKMACQVTETLRRIDPDDPLRYDFALHKLGVSGG
jgi:UDP-N-acetylmuramoylalanine--D-glutamate ligase